MKEENVPVAKNPSDASKRDDIVFCFSRGFPRIIVGCAVRVVTRVERYSAHIHSEKIHDIGEDSEVLSDQIDAISGIEAEPES